MARILLIDDEPEFLNLLALVLKRAGHQVIRAESGRAALQLIAAQPFDLLVVDNWMPGMTGLEFLRRLRANGDGTPSIVITAYAEIDNVVDAMRLGVKDFLVKPFELNGLFVSAVNRCTA